MRRITAALALAVMGVWVTSAQAGIDFHVAGTKPVEGFQKMTIGGTTLYVAPRPALMGDGIKSSNAIDVRSGTEVELTVADGTVKRLSTLMQQHKADRLVAIANGQILGAGKATVKDTSVTITGLKPILARRVSEVLNGASITQLGPAIKLVPSSSQVAPGGAIKVDAYASNFADLRVYQIALDIQGGRTGQLAVSDLQIDSTRKDFIFTGKNKIDAVDPYGARLGALLFDSSVNVAKPAYLGTFTLTSSSDAAGAFTVDVRTSDNSSFVKDGGNQGVPFFTDGAMTISVGKPERIRTDGK
jgi:hypothetical protein